MTCMIDRYHDLYHEEAPDIANCPYCQDDLVSIEGGFIPADIADFLGVDRLEDLK